MRAVVSGLTAGLVTVVLFGRPPVGAQPAAPDFAKAKTLYDDANAEMSRGRYLDAVRDYNAAYEISHDPVLFFKIGTANEKAGKCDVALSYYARYVREAKPDAHFLDLVKERVAACGGDPRNLEATDAGAGSGATTPPADTGSGSGSGSAAAPDVDAAVTVGPARPHAHVNGHDGAWLMIGGALAFATAATVLAYSASSSEQDVRDLYVGVAGITPTYDATTAQRYQDLLDEGHRYQYLSWGAYGVAAGFAIGAAIWFIHDRNEQALAITPVATPQGGSVSATVRF